MEGLEQMSEEFSFEKEKEIARTFSKRFQWDMMLIGVGQATIWLTKESIQRLFGFPLEKLPCWASCEGKYAKQAQTIAIKEP